MTRLLLINFITTIVIIIVNVYVRSQTVMEINVENGIQKLETIKKYYDIFPQLTIYSFSILIIMLIISIALIFSSQNKMRKRLEQLTTSFEHANLSKIKNDNPIYTDEDLIILEAWNKSIDNINSQVQRREKYFNSMVHDFKTPIQILRLNMQMELLENGDSKYKQKINEELKLFEDMIMRYLKIEKIAFFETPKFEQVKLQPILENLSEKYANLDYKVDFKDIDSTCEVVIDQYMFDKIAVNLIDNPMKYGVDDTIIISKTGNTIYFKNRISTALDNENIFETKSRNQSLKGNGLGVVIIKTYIELLEWNISSKVEDNYFVVELKMMTKEENNTSILE